MGQSPQESHAGYYTSPFSESATLVIDAIGEWTTISIWKNEKIVWDCSYPQSLGLFYSAMTDRVGLKPNEDEYILMGMAAYGDSDRFYKDMRETLSGIKKIFIRDVDGGNQNSPKKIILMLLLPLREYMKTYLRLCYKKLKNLQSLVI